MSVLGSLSALWLASFLAAGLALFTQILLARSVFPDEYGLYATSMTIAGILAPLASLGVPGLLLKVFGAEGESAKRWVHPAMVSLIPALVFAVAAIVLYGLAQRETNAARALAVFLAPVIVSFVGVELVLARFQVTDNLRLQALWIVIPNLLRFAVACTGWLLAWPATWFAMAIGLVSLLTGASALTIFYRGFCPGNKTFPDQSLDLSSNRPTAWEATTAAFPFGVSPFIFLLYSQGSILLLDLLLGSRIAGFFSLATNILIAIYLMPTVLSQRYLLSRFHRWASNDPDRFLQVFRACNGLLLALGGVFGIALATLGPWCVDVAFGPPYAEVAAVLAMCSLCVPARFLSSVLGAALSTGGNISHRIRAQTVVAVITLVVAIAAIDASGLAGAAAAAVLGEWLLAAAYLTGCARHVFGTGALSGWNLRFGELRSRAQS